MNSKNSSTLAIPFITFQENKGFQINPEAVQFLNSLPENRQLGIVSIVGKYRTGKSFFVNRVLLDQKKGGFQVGPTINPCTKGLWLWKKTIPSQSNKNMDLILIDTQGFGGMDQNANHDSRIFLFSLLLSSYFIYNSVGSIDQNAINTLNLIINLAKDIQTKTNSSQDQTQFPSFLWIVRDFTLKLVDKQQNSISPKQYLQNALEFQKGSSDAVQNKNKIRRLLKHFFQDRDCNVMIRPTESQKDLQKLDQIDNSLLRPQFVKQVYDIRQKVFSKARPKKINGTSLNGNLLITLCKGYMQTINKGHLPNVQSAWFYVCRSQGLKAVQEATHLLEDQVDKLLKNPIKSDQIQKYKAQIKEKIIQKFKKKSMGAEDGHPDLLQKLERKLQDQFNQFSRKNKAKWIQQYKQTAQDKIQKLRDRIYGDYYKNFGEFIQDFQQMKKMYDIQTSEGDPIQKWKHFNQLSQNLYRLAGQTITQKMNNNLLHQKQLLEQKLSMQEEQLQQSNKQLLAERQNLKEKVLNLQREISRLRAIQQSSNSRVNQYKSEYESIYNKYKNLSQEQQSLLLQLQKLKRQNKRSAEHDIEATKNQLYTIKTTIDKQRSLFQMEKKYMQEQIQRHKQRSNNLEAQSRKIRATNIKLSSDLQQIQSKYQEKCQQFQVIEQSNNNYSKKIQQLLAQNSKKNQLVGDHTEWMLEKSYLENQVSFLKNTLQQNKRLHDALLVAFQQSVNVSEGESNVQLLQANQNMSSALQKVQQRCKILQQKYSRVKQFKKLMKSCSAMQCSYCNKLIPTSSISLHVEQCGMDDASQRIKTLPDSNKQNFHITVSQTVIKQSEDRKKPYTQYSVQISKGENKWKVSKRYKEFSQLQQALINKFPSIKYPPSCNFLADINHLANNRKNMMAQERRKSLQQYLRDLSKIEQIRQSQIFKQFLQIKEDFSNNYQNIHHYQPLKKTNANRINSSQLSENKLKLLF